LLVIVRTKRYETGLTKRHIGLRRAATLGHSGVPGLKGPVAVCDATGSLPGTSSWNRQAVICVTSPFANRWQN
jgi:hypothetical protein